MLIFSFDMFAPTIKISFQCSNLGPYNLEVDAIFFHLHSFDGSENREIV